MKHLTSEQLAEWLYDESSENDEIQSHLDACSDCQSKLDEMQQVVNRLDQSEYVEPQLELDWANVFASGNKNLQQPTTVNTAVTMPVWKRFAALAAMVLIALAGFGVGDLYRSNQMAEKIDSAVSSRVSTELQQVVRDDSKRMAELEGRLMEKIQNIAAADKQFQMRLAAVVREISEEQWQTNQELQALATNTDRAFRHTNKATMRNTQALTFLRDATGMQLSY